MMVEIDEHEDNKKRDNEMKAQKEHGLVRAGEQVRDMAMKRRIGRDGDGDMDGNSSSDRECKRLKRVKVFALVDEPIVMIEEARCLQEAVRERVRLDERRIDTDGEREKQSMRERRKEYP